MNNKQNKLLKVPGQGFVEVMPTSTILDGLVHIPQHSFTSSACSPDNGLEPYQTARPKCQGEYGRQTQAGNI